MRQEPKRPSATEVESPSFGSLLMGWAQQGFDSFLATQRILVDFATRKSTDAIQTVRDTMSDPEHSPLAILTELAVEATANLTEAQRVLLNLAQQENDILMNGVKERVSGSPMAAEITEKLRRSVDVFVDMQQDFLTTMSKHTQKRLHATMAGKGPDIGCLVDAAREAMDDFVRAQKKFLDVVAMDGNKARASKDEEPHKKTEVTKLAREAADSFIEAQKKLLDLAGQQLNVNMQAASRTAEMLDALRPQLVPDLTGEGLKSFVAAEKELISSIIKPPVAAKTTQKAEHKTEHKAPKRPAARRARRRTRPAAAQAAQVGV